MQQFPVLVCVTGQLQCSRLIHAGRALADTMDARLQVLHVRTSERTMMGNTDVSAALNQLYADAREADAGMEIISSTEIEKTICRYARDIHAAVLVIGPSPADGLPPMSERLKALLPDIDIRVV